MYVRRYRNWKSEMGTGSSVIFEVVLGDLSPRETQKNNTRGLEKDYNILVCHLKWGQGHQRAGSEAVAEEWKYQGLGVLCGHSLEGWVIGMS